MPKTTVHIYQEANGAAPLLEWMDDIPPKIQDKFIKRFELLEEKGNELRRPIVDMLRDGIREIRVESGHVNYRVLYGFVGRNIILLSHGCTKKKEVPEREINLAISNLNKYKENPQGHTYKE